jgi:YidC/Oxa1 family membrane protein insertase
MKTILEFSHSVTDNYGLSIIVLSIIVNIILLPLYYIAEKWKAKDKAIQDCMKQEIDNVKKYYKGQERHFYIQTIYRRYKYHPLSSIKASVGFLIQIPFFFAAFHLLSNYQALNGVSFGILQDLGHPDHLIAGINVLPFVMTVVNLLSAYIYIELLNKSEKIQLFALAFIFLVVLYNEPAGLLLYWTMNNVFSLMKNIVEKKFKLGPLFSRTFKKEKLDMSFVKNLPFVEILLLLVVLYLYLLGIKYVSPEGITHLFTIKAQRGILYLIAIFVFFLTFSHLFFDSLKNYKLQLFENKKWSDLILILVPMMLIVQYILLNQDILSPSDSFYVLIVTWLVAVILIIILPILLSPIIPRRIGSSLSLSLVTLVYAMPYLTLHYKWHNTGDLLIQLSLLLGLFIISLYLYTKNDRLFKTIILVLFISNSLFISINKELDINKELKEQKILKINTGNENLEKYLLSKVKNNPLTNPPDIYLLTYDAYVGNETMLQYGIDNKVQEDYLLSKGFKIYKNTYSLAGGTPSTVLRMLNMSHAYPPDQAVVIGGYSLLHKILRKLNYQLADVDLHGPGFFNRKPNLDFYYPEPAAFNKKDIFIKSLIAGEFHFDADIKFGGTSITAFEKKKREFMSLDVHPKFMYTHSGPNHSQNSGKCLKDENIRYKMRLDYANKEMIKDIETVQKNNPNTIIIINGDHGPYLTSNCTGLDKEKGKVTRLDIQDRYGAFLAILWPKSIKPLDNAIVTLQDVFPVVFASIYSDTSILANSKISTQTVDYGWRTAGVYIENGIIHGGINDGEPLFLDTKEKEK